MMYGFLSRAPLYFFPALLIALEEIIRSASKIEGSVVVGVSMAAASVGMLIPLTSPKPIDPRTVPIDVLEQVSRAHGTIINEKDKAFIGIVWVFFMVFICVWAFFLTLSFGINIPDLYIKLNTKSITWSSLFVFLISVILTEIKEAL